jgi:hypothetical protein
MATALPALFFSGDAKCAVDDTFDDRTGAVFPVMPTGWRMSH